MDSHWLRAVTIESLFDWWVWLESQICTGCLQSHLCKVTNLKTHA